jgi:tetratricopeptide (TPR) repeat protein
MFWVGDLGFAEAMSRGEIRSARQAVERLAWLGRDGPGRRTELGRRFAREGDTERARAQFERSLALTPTVRGYLSLGLLHEQAGRWQAAASAYDSALTLDPEDGLLLFRSGRAWLESGRPERAVPLLERAAVIAPDEKQVALKLAQARREADARSKP